MKEKNYKVLALLLVFSIAIILIVYCVYTLIMEYRISIMKLRLDLVTISAGFFLFIVLSLLQLITEIIDRNKKDTKNNQIGNDYDN